MLVKMETQAAGGGSSFSEDITVTAGVEKSIDIGFEPDVVVVSWLFNGAKWTSIWIGALEPNIAMQVGYGSSTKTNTTIPSTSANGISDISGNTVKVYFSNSGATNIHLYAMKK